MINIERFNEIFAKFKENFTEEHWNDEKFKWEAVKRFQDVWDINAPDFLDAQLDLIAKDHFDL